MLWSRMEKTQDAEEKEELTKVALFPRVTLQGVGILEAAMATSPMEEVTSGDFSHGAGEKKKWQVIAWLFQLCGLYLEKPISLQQCSDFRGETSITRWRGRERERG